ncbi:hypothetical protein HG536_0F01010 [Torulaspora globosa]|uniref:Dynein heavy chain, cytoplasmic n=1 Tax=Torulaspora globosa TaxID=48254 RepID=A0A7G3ZJU0_9SACH|nr:uncharacterized protein HG536_0F01010 [Torulaspora globosa]QLL33776.1 hypothetical protein HG536_0F01010 [Torulaspora globosa]
MNDDDDSLVHELIRYCVLNIARLGKVNGDAEQWLTKEFNSRFVGKVRSFLFGENGAIWKTVLLVAFDKEHSELFVSIDDEPAGRVFPVLLFLKDKRFIDSRLTLESQISSIILPDEVAIKAITFLLGNGPSHAVEPVSKEGSHDDATESYSDRKRSLNDFEISLRSVNGPLAVLDLVSEAHHKIKDIVSKGANEDNYLSFVEPELIQEPSFLNALQATANGWLRTVKTVCQAEKGVRHDWVFDEVQYWSTVQETLVSIEKQLQSQEVKITMCILVSSRRWHNVLGFPSDSGLTGKLQRVREYDRFLSSIPLRTLKSSNNMEDVRREMDCIAAALKKFRFTQYPADRFALLLEQVSHEVQDAILRVSPNLFNASYISFSEHEGAILKAIDQWDGIIEESKIHLREVIRRRGDLGSFATSLKPCTNNLRDAVKELAAFRKRHYCFSQALKSIDYVDYLKDLDFVYEPINVLQNTSLVKWIESRNSYNQRLGLIEEKLIKLWKKKLNQDNSSGDIINQYTSFAPLMAFNPKLMSVMKNCQKELLNSVKQELTILSAKINQTDQLKQALMLKGLSSMSAALVERSQLNNRMQQLQNRCEMLLGRDWKKLPGGKMLLPIFKELIQKTDLGAIFEHWKGSIIKGDIEELQSPRLKIIRNQDQKYELSVNFENVQNAIFGEVKTFVFLGFEVPNDIIRLADRYEQARLSAVSMLGQVQIFLSVICELDSRPFTAILLERHLVHIWNLILNAAITPWSGFEDDREIGNSEPIENSIPVQLEKGVSHLVTSFHQFEISEARLSNSLRELSRSRGEVEALLQIISSVQLTIVQVESLQPQGIDKLILSLNSSIEKILVESSRHQLHDLTCDIPIITVSFESQNLTFSPCITELKIRWIRAVEAIVTKSASLPRISLEHPPIGSPKSFELSYLIRDDVFRTLQHIEKKCLRALTQFERLKIVETLCDLPESDIEEYIGSDINVCLDLLASLIESHTGLEKFRSKNNGELILRFASLDYRLSVTRELDYWRKVLIRLLLKLYEEEATKLDQDLRVDLKDLEKHFSSHLSLATISSILGAANRIKSSYPMRCQLLRSFSACEAIFLKFHLELACDHVFLDQLESDAKALEDRLQAVDEFIESNRKSVIHLLDSKEISLSEQSYSLLNDWQITKQALGGMKSIDALHMIKTFRNMFKNIADESEQLYCCSKSLAYPLVQKDRLKNAFREFDQFETGYRQLNDLQNSLSSLLQRSWSLNPVEDMPNELRRQKDEIKKITDLTHQDSEAVEVIELIKSLEKDASLLRDMKNADMGPRHWKMIFSIACTSKLGNSAIESQSFTLQDIINVDLSKNGKIIREIISSAQREAGLQKSLSRIKEFWMNAQFGTFLHESGMILVSDWSHIQQLCSDDLEELAAMKNSTFYCYLEQDCLELESKLATFSAIVPDWADLQVNWLDLFGILGNEGKLQHLIPTESAKFRRLTSDFHDLLSRIFRLPSALDVILIPESDAAFKRMLNTVRMIKSSLSGFLEQQRELFPRFYFLGNRDLLRLLGAGSDISQVSCYLSKIFGSITDLEIDNHLIKGVYSAEGELLEIFHPIATDAVCGPHEWLNALDLEIRNTLVKDVEKCLSAISKGENFLNCIDSHVFQVLLLTWQISWTAGVDECINKGGLFNLRKSIEDKIYHLSLRPLYAENRHDRQKVRSLIIELMHCARVVTELLDAKTSTVASAIWHRAQKFYYVREKAIGKVYVKQCNSVLNYSFNYIGVPERLIYTSTMEEAFSALIEALTGGFGGCLFGPAGTGKTETIKALSQNLGKMVLVFNCDDSFDFLAMSRLIIGIAQIGAWACFDELNRLHESVLSSVTGHVKMIQDAISLKFSVIESMGRSINLNPDTGLFVTLNPGYEGRSHLPDNLKRQFREYSIIRADIPFITQVMFRVLGFRDAAALAQRLVDLFTFLSDTCSRQKHYDFGLRSVKKVLLNCTKMMNHDEKGMEETCLLRRSLTQIVLPGFNVNDECLYFRKVMEIFPQDDSIAPACSFTAQLPEACEKECVILSESFLKKCQQLYHMQTSQQAIIIMGHAGVGKTAVWKTTLRAMRNMDGLNNIIYVIDTKTMGKEGLYGEMNRATLEWKDGIFTSILRTVNDDSNNLFGSGRVWVVLDSDLDPEYIETLNSTLDDNKVLTLPTGERIPVSSNIRLILEVENLEHVTPATMTRCAILWLSIPTYSATEQLDAILAKEVKDMKVCHGVSTLLIERLQSTVGRILSRGNLSSLITKAKSLKHILGFEQSKVIPTLIRIFSNDIIMNRERLETLGEEEQIKFLIFRLYQILLDVMAGDVSASDQEIIMGSLRSVFDEHYNNLSEKAHLEMAQFVDATLKYTSFNDLLQERKQEHHNITKANTVIATVETLRYEKCISDMLKVGRPVVLCGRPGSGKTMLISNIVSQRKNFQLVSMNFSKDTSVSHIFKTLNRHMKYVDGPKGLTLCPKDSSKNVVLFCDELNLPKPDKYGAQGVILFLRQLIEKGGFWRYGVNKWVFVDRLHVIGACNPSTDFGRVHMSPRFLRHVSILFIDHPSSNALLRIYESLINHSIALTPCINPRQICEASLSVYKKCQSAFTPDSHPHYTCSPREMTRWVKGLYSTITDANATVPSLLRVWAYEAWRVFADRLVTEEEKSRFRALLTETINEFFPEQIVQLGDTSGLLFSSWISTRYEEVSRADILAFLKGKNDSFCEEKGYKLLILHDEMLNHVLRIDRVLKQVQGHAMLIGAGRTGKATMVEFVCWMNDIDFLRPSIHKKYGIAEFDSYLRNILLKCTVDEQRICLVIDDSSIRETIFLERMNTLLANSDIPDLFQEEQYDILMSSLKQKFESLGYSSFSEEDLYDWFVQQISRNLHVVFIICDSVSEKGSQIISSPALFNRCVINWVGTWSLSTLKQLSQELFKSTTVLTVPTNKDDPALQNIADMSESSLPDILSQFHQRYCFKNYQCGSPSFLLDTIWLFKRLLERKHSEMEKDKQFLVNGLKKIDEAVFSFEDLTNILKQNEAGLKSKESEARETLDKILSEQNEAEQKQAETRHIQLSLAKREEEAKHRHDLVQSDLKNFEPVMRAAQLGVKNIKKQHLTEIRSMTNPPVAVKLILEAVCSLLGHQTSNWRSIQQFVRSDEFIPKILHFDAETKLTKEANNFVKDKYLSSPEFSFEKVHRASKACGPLFQWASAQVRFGEVLEKIEPIKLEAKRLEVEALLSKEKLLTAENMAKKVEESIKQSKNDYMRIFRDMEHLRSNMNTVQAKLARSKSLINNLSEEKARWERKIERFRQKAASTIGNCLISSVMYTYFGKLDEKQRSGALEIIISLLQDNKIECDPNYDFISENMTIADQHIWLSHGLMNKSFFLNNLIMILDSDVVPYIIDPNSEVSSILSKRYGASLRTISFLESDFKRKFVNAVKFSNMLLINDADHFDPVISNVVISLTQKSKLARTARIGDLEVSLPTEFCMFLHSTDGNKTLPSFLNSRVRVVNFSISRATIQTRAVRAALTYEAPEIDFELQESIELNSSYAMRLRSLESQILNELNESKGSILESDDLIEALGKVKQESNEITIKLDKNQDVIRRVNEFSVLYANFALHCTCIYFILERFKQLHWFYEIPMWQFFSCLRDIFLSCQQVSHMDTDGRLKMLTSIAYQKLYSSFSACLSERDRRTLAFIMSSMQCYSVDMEVLSQSFQAFLAILNGWKRDDGENTLPEELADLKGFIEKGSYGAAINWAEKGFSDKISIEQLSSSNVRKSIVIATDRGSDCSSEVIRLAEAHSQSLSVIALGSPEGTAHAEQEISCCASKGGWILLQNIQMSMSWVQSFLVKKIEQQLENMDVWEKDFKIFMSCTFSGVALPPAILQQSYKVTVEGTPTILEQVKTLWKTLTAHSSEASPLIVACKFLLAWFHAILDARSRLVPVGFAKSYDFNDCDLQSGLRHIKDTVNATKHETIELICEQLHFSLGRIIYGGKVDDDEDLKIVQEICRTLFQPAAINCLTNLNEAHEFLPGLTLPKGLADEKVLSAFLDQVSEPTNYYTSWLGLPEDAIHRFEFNAIRDAVRGAIAILQ